MSSLGLCTMLGGHQHNHSELGFSAVFLFFSCCSCGLMLRVLVFCFATFASGCMLKLDSFFFLIFFFFSSTVLFSRRMEGDAEIETGGLSKLFGHRS
jgi:hypothetical protein